MPNRRRFIVAAACTLPLLFVRSPLQSDDRRIDLLAIGDWGNDSDAQRAVASAMKKYVQRRGIGLDAVLLLGDNFYVDLDGVEDPAWQKLFEQMYDPGVLAAPFYAVLGNHDHEDGKAQIELDYARQNPRSRFKMPDFWYQVDLPDRSPLVRLIGLDSDHDSIGEERWNEQARWLDRELSQPARGRWTIVFAHHPLFSDAAHGDDQKLQEDWGPSFKKHGVDFYLAGHDHDLEHLQMPGWPTSFVVSGAGGKETYEIEKHRAAFAREAHGFVHIRLTADTARVSFIDKKGERVYAFVRDRRGRVKTVGDRETGNR